VGSPGIPWWFRPGECGEDRNEIGENVSPISPFSHNGLGSNCAAGPAFEEHPSSIHWGFDSRGAWFPLDNSNARYPGVTLRKVPLIAYSLAIG
jgi:hypothetical protein